MAVNTYLTTAELHDIARYGGTAGFQDAVGYEGSVRAHPYDKTRFLLITTGNQELSHFYEFKKADVVAVETVREMVTSTGTTMQIMRVGVKRGSRGIEMKPFQVT